MEGCQLLCFWLKSLKQVLTHVNVVTHSYTDMLVVVYQLSLILDTSSAIAYNYVWKLYLTILHTWEKQVSGDFFSLCMNIKLYNSLLISFSFHYFLLFHNPLKTAHPQKIVIHWKKVKLNSYTLFSKQKGFASHNCLASGKQREEKKHLQEKDRQTGQVCEALKSRNTRWPPRCNMATTTNNENYYP